MLDGGSVSADTEITRLRQRYDALKGSTERTNCESTWQEIAEVCSPRKLDFVGLRTPGEKKMQRVYDPTGITGVEMLAAGLHGMATNPAAKWFSLTLVTDEQVPGDDGEFMDLGDHPEVQRYLSDVEKVMWSRMYSPGTNFTTALHEVYMDLAAFGTAILFVGKQVNGGLLFECRPLAECVIAESPDGKVDTVFRKTDYTVSQLWQLQNIMGWKVSDAVRDKYEDQKYDDKVTVIHAVYPRPDNKRDPSQEDAQNMAWASCYFEHEEMHKLDETGFREFPYQVARWSKYGGEVYGRGPGHTARPDMKMLQAMSLTQIKLLQKAADPPLWLKDDGVVGQTRTIPGGVNYWRGNPNDGVMLQPVNLAGVQYLEQSLQALRERILRTFYTDLMRINDRPNMTATEVMQRTQEMLRLFGPLIGRLESEMLGPLVDRVFGILSNDGLLPEPPKQLQGKEFTVEFVSPIATAQKQGQAEAMMQVLNMVSALGEEAALSILAKNLDGDKVFRHLWHLFNNDPDLLKDEGEAEQMNEMEHMQEAMAMGQQGANLAGTGAGALKQLTEAGVNGTALADSLPIGELMQAIGQNVQGDPQAQNELGGLLDYAGADVADPGAILDEEDEYV